MKIAVTIKLFIKNKDKIKAERKGNRDAELELSNGFVSVDKAHKNKKKYTRKTKHKNNK